LGLSASRQCEQRAKDSRDELAHEEYSSNQTMKLMVLKQGVIAAFMFVIDP
jgi:hypothetical protein